MLLPDGVGSQPCVVLGVGATTTATVRCETEPVDTTYQMVQGILGTFQYYEVMG